MPTDRSILRGLAGDLAEIAALPVQRERIRQWTALNDLRPERPMIWITEIPWGEFENDIEELRPVCRDPELRGIECRLRHKLFTARHLETDEVVNPYWEVPMAISNAGDGYGVRVEEDLIPQGRSYIQSHGFKPVIRGPEDLEKIPLPLPVVHDASETCRRLSFFNSLFGDILPPVPVGARDLFNCDWDHIVRWTGVTEALIDLVERPEYIHALMRRVTDSFLRKMDQLEAQGLLTPSTGKERIGSGAAGYTTELPGPDAPAGRLRTMDQWGGATAQIFASVSPAMQKEFALDYEIETMSRCGLNYYGCCEALHDKMGILSAVPRLRKVSVSPWCDAALAAERAGRPLVFSHKPNPAIVAEESFSAERARADVRKRLADSGPMPCEFILKDISTTRGDVRRVIEWCRVAHEEAVNWKAPKRPF